MTTLLKLHETYRYPKPAPRVISDKSDDAYESFFEVTRWPAWPGLQGAGRAQLERGIDSVTPVRAPDGLRRPAILIGINPSKAGSDWTPWHDEIDPRNGFVRYYGDNKPGLQVDPDHTTGNRAVLAEFGLYGSNRATDRMRAAPLLVFESVVQRSRSKGYRRFRGVGLVERAERVVQVDRHDEPFVNYRFDCALLSLKDENNLLNWDWIASRRDPTKTLERALAGAPAAWRRWVDRGPEVLDRVRQRLQTYRIVSEADQQPVAGSRGEAVLREVMDFYPEGRKSRFEALAERIAQVVLGDYGSYHLGWVTRGTGDRGIDFVGRLDLGTNAGPLRVVVAGQAKCQRGASGVAEISRLASKLGRGWVGVFITTGHFSQQAQRELQDDAFPILLVSGRQVGEIVARVCAQEGVGLREYLARVDVGYEERIQGRDASEVLRNE